MQLKKCDIFGIPELLIEWYRNGKWNSSHDHYMLTPTEVRHALDGLQETPERHYYLPVYEGMVRVSYRETDPAILNSTS